MFNPSAHRYIMWITQFFLKMVCILLTLCLAKCRPSFQMNIQHSLPYIKWSQGVVWRETMIFQPDIIQKQGSGYHEVQFSACPLRRASNEKTVLLYQFRGVSYNDERISHFLVMSIYSYVDRENTWTLMKRFCIFMTIYTGKVLRLDNVCPRASWFVRLQHSRICWRIVSISRWRAVPSAILG